MSRQTLNWASCLLFAGVLVWVGHPAAAMPWLAASFVILSLPKEPKQ